MDENGVDNRESNDDIYRLHIMSQKDRAVMIMDNGGNITVWNPGAEKIHGYPGNEIIGRHFSLLYPPADVQMGKPYYEIKLAETQGRFEAEGWRLRRDGNVFLAHEVISALRDQNDVLRGFSKITSDVTEKRRKEEELLKHRYLLQEAQRLARIGTWSWEVGHGLKWSDEMYSIVGRTIRNPPESMNEFSRIYCPESWEIISDCIEKALTEGLSYELDCELVRPDGRHLWVTCRGEAVRDVQGNITGLRGTIQDIHERKEAEKARLDSENLRRYADGMKSGFLANMSHELLTPLQEIIGLSELLKSGFLGDMNNEQKQFTEDIYAGGQRLLFLINDILDIAKLEAHELKLNLVPVQISSVFEINLSLVRKQALEKNIAIDIDIAANIRAVMLDKSKLHQIVYHLLSNAVKFTSDEGHVGINVKIVSRDEIDKFSSDIPTRRFDLPDNDFREFLELEIRDNGIGIPVNYLDLMFHPFSRLDAGDARKFSGTGLGLALVKQIVELHGGTVRVESAEGQGACFKLWLPYRSGDDNVG